MSRRAGRRKPMAEINVVPYIDVTLVLLVIFMITAPLLQSGVDVDLPQVEAEAIDQPDTPPVIISIDDKGLYYIDIGDQVDDPVSDQQILIRVKAVLLNNPETAVYIKGHEQVEYGKVVTVMAALRNAGVPKVGLMTRPYTE